VANQKLEIVVLCGGAGIRAGGLTLKRQKCMLEVEGKPILEYVFETIIEAFGKAKVVLALGHSGQDVRKYFGERYKTLQLKYTKKSVAGTRLALLISEGFVKGKQFLLMDGDIIVKPEALAKLAELKESDLLGRMLVSAKHEKAPTHGLVIVKNHRVVKIVFPSPKSIPRVNAFRFMDVGFYSRDLFERAKSYDASTITDVLSNSVRDGNRVEGVVYKADWFHFVTPKDLEVSIRF